MSNILLSIKLETIIADVHAVKGDEPLYITKPISIYIPYRNFEVFALQASKERNELYVMGADSEFHLLELADVNAARLIPGIYKWVQYSLPKELLKQAK